MFEVKKKRITVIGILLACSLCGVIAFLQLQPQLVTGKKTELRQIVITDYGSGESETIKAITTIDDQQIMYAIYEKLQKATPIRGNYMETEYTMVAPHYRIVFCYFDKEDEVSVYSTSAGRYLGKPDMFTVSKTTGIDSFIEKMLNDRK